MPDPVSQPHAQPTNAHERVEANSVPPAVTALLLMIVFAGFGAFLILFEHVPGRVFYDQELYHLPTIKQFAAQWPDFDFWHYLSATTPGYHLLMAAVAKFISPSIFALQIASLVISLMLVLTLAFAVARRTTPLLTLAICLPFLASPYVIGSAAWLLPDNLGWLGVLCILLIALRPRLTPGALLAGGAVLLGLVFVRQIHIWTAGLLWAGAYLKPPSRRDALGAPDNNQETPLRQCLFSNFKVQILNALLSLLCTLPAFVLLLLFIRYWGGAVPPVFQQWYHTYNLSAGVFILSLFGIWGLFFAPTWLPHLLRFWRHSRTWFIAISVVVVAFGLAIPTNDFAAARHTGLWGLAERCPTVGHTSLLMLALMLLGLLPVAALLFAAPPRQRMIFLTAILGFAAANTANNDLFQRYVDPFVLMLLAIMSAASRADQPEAATTNQGKGSPATPPNPLHKLRKAQMLGPMALAAILAAVSFRDITRNFALITDPPPAPRGLSKYDNPNDPSSKPVPCELPRPPMPPGKHFWP